LSLAGVPLGVKVQAGPAEVVHVNVLVEIFIAVAVVLVNKNCTGYVPTTISGGKNLGDTNEPTISPAGTEIMVVVKGEEGLPVAPVKVNVPVTVCELGVLLLGV
jgi:hypothetical protein